ncbi:hypothetical protein HJC23_005699 [Cyclotella cryptica]|uniref:Uncharacterized protein n=1 Tax=Cyclotella cryptica TaxID=29204 RepID=A0ABD3P4X3_9STRA
MAKTKKLTPEDVEDSYGKGGLKQYFKPVPKKKKRGRPPKTVCGCKQENHAPSPPMHQRKDPPELLVAAVAAQVKVAGMVEE